MRCLLQAAYFNLAANMVPFNSVYITLPPDAHVCVCNVFVTYHLSPVCLNRRRDHIHGNLQVYWDSYSLSKRISEPPNVTKKVPNFLYSLIFASPCIIDINNIDNQLDATITVY